MFELGDAENRATLLRPERRSIQIDRIVAQLSKLIAGPKRAIFCQEAVFQLDNGLKIHAYDSENRATLFATGTRLFATGLKIHAIDWENRAQRLEGGACCDLLGEILANPASRFWQRCHVWGERIFRRLFVWFVSVKLVT